MRFKLLLLIFLVLISNPLWAIEMAADAENNYQSSRESLRAAGVTFDNSKIIVNHAIRLHIAPEIVNTWASRINALNQQMLPTNGFVDRIQQGLAKNIDPNRINSALDKLVSGLNWGKVVIEQRVAKADRHSHPDLVISTIENLEIARRQGFSENQLEDMLGDSPLSIGQITQVSILSHQWNALGIQHDDVIDTLGLAIDAGSDRNILLKIDSMMMNGVHKGMDFKDIHFDMNQFFHEMHMEFGSDNSKLNSKMQQYFNSGNGSFDWSGDLSGTWNFDGSGSFNNYFQGTWPSAGYGDYQGGYPNNGQYPNRPPGGNWDGGGRPSP